MTTQAEIAARYNRVEREADAAGRIIGVRKLRVSEQTRIEEMTPNLDGLKTVWLPSSEAFPDGKEVQIDRRTFMIAAASVCEIDNVPIPFPRTRGELDSIADRLDEEGIAAALGAYARLQPKPVESGEPVAGDDPAKK